MGIQGWAFVGFCACVVYLGVKHLNHPEPEKPSVVTKIIVGDGYGGSSVVWERGPR